MEQDFTEEYTSGKLAELCGVSVRTVQYYDSRNLLVPGKFSSGGRRLYSRQDLHKLKIILFLRDLDFSINDIRKILSGKNPEKTISCLISQQESFIKNEISAGQNRLEKLLQVKEGLKDFEKISFDSIGVVAKMIENKKKLKNLHVFMIVVGVLMDIIEIGTAVFWWKTGIWQPFALGMVVVVFLGIYISLVYFKKTAYICPLCQRVFKPPFREAFFAAHTPRTRRLVCPGCHEKSYCVETYSPEPAKEPEV